LVSVPVLAAQVCSAQGIVRPQPPNLRPELRIAVAWRHPRMCETGRRAAGAGQKFLELSDEGTSFDKEDV
jgi:hypothetical protein